MTLPQKIQIVFLQSLKNSISSHFRLVNLCFHGALFNFLFVNRKNVALHLNNQSVETNKQLCLGLLLWHLCSFEIWRIKELFFNLASWKLKLVSLFNQHLLHHCFNCLLKECLAYVVPVSFKHPIVWCSVSNHLMYMC